MSNSAKEAWWWRVGGMRLARSECCLVKPCQDTSGTHDASVGYDLRGTSQPTAKTLELTE